MKIIGITLKNWLNYHLLDVKDIGDRVFIIGPNACGKSNLLDAFRFLRDVALPAGKKPSGGGLQTAVKERGGLSKLRWLNTKKDTEIVLGVTLEDDNKNIWHYELGFRGEAKGNNRLVITKEIAEKNGSKLMERPDKDDERDPDRLTQSHLELTTTNKKFRELSHFFAEITYLHLVPQLLKYSKELGGNILEQDPFGQSFLRRIAATGQQVRDSRLKRIQNALSSVIPQFKEFRFQKDEITGEPHIEARFEHWRPNAGWQRENQFSDGTLRIIGLLWSLMETNSLLLLEEPELSLNEEIVKVLPGAIYKILQSAKTTRQIFITTHSESLLSDESLADGDIIRLAPSKQGTLLASMTEEEKGQIKAGFPIGSTLLQGTNPDNIRQFTNNLR